MAISPNTTIHVLRGIPITNEYKDTLYFSSQIAQESYFVSKTKTSLINSTYQRTEEGKIRLNTIADTVYDCNYVMFQNSAYNNKWFYGFITEVEYVNDETCIVKFEIDYVQTWLLDFNVKQCFVEREHSLTDNIGDNLIQEKLEFGDYIYDDLGLTSLFNLPQIIIASTFDYDLNDAVGGLYGGVYSGLNYLIFSSYTSANTFLESVTTANKGDGIVAIFMLPIAFTADYDETIPEVFNIERDKNINNIDGYVPNNKKLFTHPYNMLYVTNNEGRCANYNFEYFSDTKCNFNVSGSLCCTPEVMLTPLNYKGVAKNYNEKMLISNFPQCSYNIDSFKAYIAQNANRIATESSMGAVQTIGGAVQLYASGGLVGGGNVSGGLTSTLNTLATLSDKSTLPPQARGGQNSYINFAEGIKGFQFYYAHIRYEFARIIDDFFTMYGYATHRVKTPNINSRPHWNYVKTIGSCVTGNIPSKAMSTINKSFDTGITFWKNGDEVGNYSLNNNP